MENSTAANPHGKTSDHLSVEIIILAIVINLVC